MAAAGGEKKEERDYAIAAAEAFAADVSRLLAGFRQHLHDRTAHHLGYPYNLNLNLHLSALQAQFHNFCIINLGDPFIESNYGVHSRPLEVAVLDWFARLWDLQKDQYWGYITSCGTEGNLHGLLVGRELFPDGIIYASTESHYSVFKAARMYRVKCVKAPKVTFQKPIGSVSVSGHKFLGCPAPCGVVITRREHVNVLSTDIEYLSSRDATIMGSRNGHAPIFLWYTLNKKGYRGIRKEVQKCLRNAHYLLHHLREVGVSASLNPLSNTVVFERPRDEAFVHRWQLACEGNIAHVVVMPNVTIEKITSFVEDLANNRADWYQDDESVLVPCIAKDIGQENCLCGLHNKKSSRTA
ncbi:hypothetical protein C2845_PM07G36130 [Panicum miliaceum]|uniref:Histidine decarboxylase n=1 Tax=Panicum miliaceum TaxID=4540 RepID=A0A3L6SIX7_PANMI|nr:hypothetical protein C2845_PM07G36130 [Panicum miliaceum]